MIHRAYHQIDHDGRAHHHKADGQEAVHQRDVGYAGHANTYQHLVSDAGQDSDERDTDPVTERRTLHPEYREREQYDYDEGENDQSI